MISRAWDDTHNAATSLLELKRHGVWSPLSRRPRVAKPRALRPHALERKTAHRADAHFAADGVAGDLAGEGQRQRHRVGDRDFPGHVVAVDGAVEDRAGLAVGALGAGQRAALALQGEIGVTLAHRRAHGNFPVSVDRHLFFPLFPSTKPEWSAPGT